MNYYQPNYNQFYQNQMTQQTNQTPVQSGSLISVHDENEARMYPVGPGYSITFKDENQPYIYTKTMGFSQLDRPVFERYKLIKEEVPEIQNLPVDSKYALKDDLTNALNKIMDLEEEILALKRRTEETQKGGN